MMYQRKTFGAMCLAVLLVSGCANNRSAGGDIGSVMPPSGEPADEKGLLSSISDELFGGGWDAGWGYSGNPEPESVSTAAAPVAAVAAVPSTVTVTGVLVPTVDRQARHVLVSREFNLDQAGRPYGLVLFRRGGETGSGNNRIFCDRILNLVEWEARKGHLKPIRVGDHQSIEIAPLYWPWNGSQDEKGAPVKPAADAMPIRMSCNDIIEKGGAYDFARAKIELRRADRFFGGGLRRAPGPFIVGIKSAGRGQSGQPGLVLDFSCVDPNRFWEVSEVLLEEFVLSPDEWSQDRVAAAIAPEEPPLTVSSGLREMGVRLLRIRALLDGQDIEETGAGACRAT